MGKWQKMESFIEPGGVLEKTKVSLEKTFFSENVWCLACQIFYTSYTQIFLQKAKARISTLVCVGFC